MKSHSTPLFLFAVTLVLLSIWVSGALGADSSTAAASAPRLSVKEIVIASSDAGIVENTVSASHDCRHVSFVAAAGGKGAAVVDGARGAVYENLDPPVWSPDGKHWAHTAKHDGKWHVVADGKEGPAYDAVMSGMPVWSPDSSHLAYTAQRGGKWLVVSDGVESKASYDEVAEGHPLFSKNGRGMCFGAMRGGKWLIVFNGVEGAEYAALDRLTMSDDGKRIAYAAMVNGKACPVIDGAAGKPCDMIGSMHFSPDGKKLAYEVQRGGKWLVSVGGADGKSYDDVLEGSTAFSPDGRLVYAARTGKKVSVVIGGVESAAAYDDILSRPVLFSRDGKHMTFVASRGGKELVVHDGVEGKPYSAGKRTAGMGPGANDSVAIGYTTEGGIRDLVMAPDGKRVAYVASRNGKDFVVTGGEGPAFDSVAPASVAFSADGAHVAYVAVRGDKYYVVLDGVESAAYASILPCGAFDETSAYNTIARKNGKFIGCSVSPPGR